MKPFGVVTLETETSLGGEDPLTPVSLALLQTFPRFTMVAGDFETVRGAWAFRGELAAFLDDRLQRAAGEPVLEGRSFDTSEFRFRPNTMVDHWPVVIVSQSLARRLFPDGLKPLEKRTTLFLPSL